MYKNTNIYIYTPSLLYTHARTRPHTNGSMKEKAG